MTGCCWSIWKVYASTNQWIFWIFFVKVSMRFQTRIQCTTRPFSDGRKNEKNKDNNAVFDAVLTDLSKAFDRIPHDLIIAKLNAFGFDKTSLSFICVCHYNRK